MITVTINGTSVPAERASEGWVNQMIADSHLRRATYASKSRLTIRERRSFSQRQVVAAEVAV